jgi:hypothetical protein
MPIDIFEALKWVGLGLARIFVIVGLLVGVAFYIGRATDKREADLIHLSLCRKQAVTPQDYANCK